MIRRFVIVDSSVLALRRRIPRPRLAEELRPLFQWLRSRLCGKSAIGPRLGSTHERATTPPFSTAWTAPKTMARLFRLSHPWVEGVIPSRRAR